MRTVRAKKPSSKSNGSIPRLRQKARADTRANHCRLKASFMPAHAVKIVLMVDERFAEGDVPVLSFACFEFASV